MVIRTLPDNVSKLLSHAEIESHKNIWDFHRNVIEQIMAIADERALPKRAENPEDQEWVPDPKWRNTWVLPERRVRCPLCNGMPESGWGNDDRGFAYPTGLERHLAGWGRMNPCAVLEMVRDEAREYYEALKDPNSPESRSRARDLAHEMRTSELLNGAYLSQEEMQSVTGYKARNYQARWLEEHGIEFQEYFGSVYVKREHYEARRADIGPVAAKPEAVVPPELLRRPRSDRHAQPRIVRERVLRRSAPTDRPLRYYERRLAEIAGEGASQSRSEPSPTLVSDQDPPKK